MQRSHTFHSERPTTAFMIGNVAVAESRRGRKMHYTHSPRAVQGTAREDCMDHEEDAGLDFIEGFSLLAGAIWIIGALVLGAMVVMGLGRV